MTPSLVHAPAPRPDLYAAIHKGLRLFMTDTLARLGRLDPADGDELQHTLAQLDALLDLCAGHLQHENSVIHPALEARRPGLSARIGAEHDDQRQALADLAAERQALAAQPQAGVALRLYRRTSRFVAQHFEHMLAEETRLGAALCELYSDAELADLQQRLVAAMRPGELRLAWHWMLPALSPQERAAELAALPAAPRAAVLALARTQLGEAGWRRLCQALPDAAAACPQATG